VVRNAWRAAWAAGFAGLVFGLALMAMTGCASSPAIDPTPHPKVTLRLVAPNDLLPLARELAAAYHDLRPYATIQVEQVTATGAEAIVLRSQADLLLTTLTPHPPTPSPSPFPAQGGAGGPGWSEDSLSIDGLGQQPLAVAVSVRNPLTGLSLEQIRQAFSGEILHWSDLGGGTGDVEPIVAEPGSEDWEAFDQLVMAGTRVTPRARLVAGGLAAARLVATLPGGIAFAPLAGLPDGVKALALDGVAPTAEAVSQGRYPLVRTVLLVSRVGVASDVRDFIDFALAPTGQAVVRRVIGGE
jgi:ABC-type phosphate transport system substrate-binding protein